MTSVRTRDGIQTTMAGINPQPVTGLLGLLYSPEIQGETFFQLPCLFDYSGQLQYENPVGTGKMWPFAYDLFTPPAHAQMIATQTANKGWMAFSDLSQPLSTLAVVDPKTKKIWPFGMKPFGWTWTKNTPVLVGEMATPTTPGGNGHTYRCIVAGATDPANEPIWPTNEGGAIVDGTAEWQEYTAVMANRLSPPPGPALGIAGGGAWAANLDVYIVLTLLNGMGECLPSVPVKITTFNPNNTITVPAPQLVLGSLPGWMQELAAPYRPTGFNIYTASVGTGGNAPPITSYSLYNVSPIALGSGITNCTGPGAGAAPPTICTARITPGQLPNPDTAPTIERVPAAGAFPVGRDVYVLFTYENGTGETTAGPTSSVINTALNDGIEVTVEVPEDDNGKALFSILNVGIYECDVPTGTPAPASSEFQFFGFYSAGSAPTITAAVAGSNPPTANTTGPGGNITADTETGGINGTQGFRYAAIMYMNQNYTVSGFTAASVIKYAVDEDGWELGVFKVATGPDYVLARPIAFTVADGSQAGGFWWIGNVNLQIPSANFVYPQTIVSDSVAMSATVIEDNATTNATFNFTDDYLKVSNNVTDRLQVMFPPQGVHVMYSETYDRLFVTGAPGYYNGTWASLAADYESFYADKSFLTSSSDSGERAWGVSEYRGTLYLMRERSGCVISATPNQANSWDVTKRWSDVGACGPRAFDACGMFMVFIHRSGIYKYETSTPDLMTKEVPYFWRSINWLYANTICCKIDHEKHEVHLLVPVGDSTVPNQEIVLNYLEGWNNPIHFSTYSAKEISMDACRKYSVNDISAWVCDRIERALPPPPEFPGNSGLPVLDSTYYISQFVYGSSGYDGTVQAVTPGVFNDNGAGIDCVYETVAPETTMALSKIEGFTLNARGNGTLYPYAIGGRAMVTGQDDKGPIKSLLLPLRPIDLGLMESEGISRMSPSRVNERWRLRFTNGKKPDAWFSLKWLSIYTIPFAASRDQSESGG